MYAVIMAGGKGERLWPKSTRGRGKHVLAFGTKNVMIQETIKRLRTQLPAQNIYLITSKSQYPFLRPYLSLLERKNVILEPEGKDTAAAVCLAALILEKRFGNVPMVVLPADHIIKDTKRFFNSLSSAQKAAGLTDGLVTIGIRPKYPSIGYGYIATGRSFKGYYAVTRFIEKPGKKKAEEIYKQKHIFWNSGIFVWRTHSILNILKRYMPGLYYSLKDATALEGRKGYAIKLANEYARLTPLSIDYAVMEPAARNKLQKLFCIRADFDWIDIGSWSSLEEIYDKDKNGNVVLAKGALIDVQNSIILGERGHKIGAIGVRDLIIVQTKSGTLVCNKDRTQEVKNLVKKF